MYGKKLQHTQKLKEGQEYKRLLDLGNTEIQIAIQFHVTQKTVKNRLKYYQDNTYRKETENEAKPYFITPDLPDLHSRS